MNQCKGGSDYPGHFAVANGTALHWAVYYGQLEIAQLLLDNGAGINIASSPGLCSGGRGLGTKLAYLM